MSSYLVHMDPVVFPEPKSFKPERWIEAAEKGQHLTKFLVSFGKGSRICLGMKYVFSFLFAMFVISSMLTILISSLAYAELFMTLASLIRRFDVELYEPRAESLRIDRDMGIGQPMEGEFSVRAKITRVLTE